MDERDKRARWYQHNAGWWFLAHRKCDGGKVIADVTKEYHSHWDWSIEGSTLRSWEMSRHAAMRAVRRALREVKDGDR